MALIDDLRAVLGQLAQLGWRDYLFQTHGLDILAADLESELLRPLQVNRTEPGFEDFALTANTGVLAGHPESSLLYHSLASPNVHLPPVNGMMAPDSSYPASQDLDLVENYIYSLQKDQIDLTRAVICVFAYEYRPAEGTTHGRMADFVYSRTGVARVGESPEYYSRAARGHCQEPGTKGLSVFPARYGAFLARKKNLGEVSLLGKEAKHDGDRVFLLPFHKLFKGPECVAGCDLEVEFSSYHRNEKLRLAVTEGELTLPKGLDKNQAPFLREDTDIAGITSTPAMVRLNREGAVVWVRPRPDRLVRRATQKNSVTGNIEIARFSVPPAKRPLAPILSLSTNRHLTSLMIVTDLPKAIEEVILIWLKGHPPKVRPRNAPEFVSIRHKVQDEKDLNSTFDLNTLPEADFTKELENGGYWAAFFEDGICDGCVAAHVRNLPRIRQEFAAFSIVAAPDFFPYADALQIQEWVRKHKDHNAANQFKEGGPDPLCRGRFGINPALHWPDEPSTPVFDPMDETVVAIVGRPPKEAPGARQPRQTSESTGSLRVNPASSTKRRGTQMTDGASNEFGPGWEVTYSDRGGRPFYSTYGLGSPFLEDVKFCASANAYWPAASPDASRTFHRQDTPTAIPLLDAELGYHPDDPDNLTKAALPGWDGEFRPFFVEDRTAVNHSSLDRGDYISNYLNSTFGANQLLLKVGSEELIRRMDCLRACIEILPGAGKVNSTKLWLVSAQTIATWPNGSPMDKDGYKYEFAVPKGDPEPSAGDLRRMVQQVDKIYTCHVTQERVMWREGLGNWHERLVIF
ncbi:MAG TPA: hypothetical protein VMF06_11100 [Candidatus Limnocylindria bacterium]|jgi:hypothetical protein|nr:hypothetical protein [Candidatus Limnocylindria bacterium]